MVEVKNVPAKNVDISMTTRYNLDKAILPTTLSSEALSQLRLLVAVILVRVVEVGGLVFVAPDIC